MGKMKDTEVGDVFITVFPYGWVLVGRLYRDDDGGRLEHCHVIRNWGTKKGLGEIAIGGPTKDTVLDSSGVVRFRWDSMVLRFQCDQTKWKGLC